jgi:hypothetical protein
MKKIIQLLILILLIYTCSSDEISNDQNNTIPSKLIESLSFDNETNVDSLFYNTNNRLILKKEYLNIGQLDYNSHYQYNSNDNLIRIYRIHSSAIIPIEEVNYTYYSNGNLKSRNYIGYNSNYTDNFEYELNTIIVNRDQNNEIKINLDSNNRILSAERKNNNNEFYVFKSYTYENDNISEVIIYDEIQNYISFFFEYDDKNNPFFVFDYDLPNSLSVKKIEAVILNSNYPSITIGDDDNYFGFLNKNNVVFCSGNSSSNYNYNYFYNSENYPNRITYEFLFNPNSLIITYY